MADEIKHQGGIDVIVRSVLPPWPLRSTTGLCGIWNDEGSAWLSGPWACFGKSDNEGAAMKGNPNREPCRPWGDHPTGRYEILGVVDLPSDKEYSYGKYFIRLKAVSGDCCGADRQSDTQDDRPGLAIHGGAEGGIYRHKLRPTYGCLRLYNLDMAALAAAVRELKIKIYECIEQGNPAAIRPEINGGV